MPPTPLDRPPNRLLRAMAATDFARLAPLLEPVEFRLRQPMVEPAQPLAHVWFIDHGVASVVASTPLGNQAEVAIVGYEGLIDVAAINGAGTTPLESFIQIPGRGHRLAVADLDAAAAASAPLRGLLQRYAQAFTIQVAHTALANATHTIDERLARWLVMSQDRVGGQTVVITHEFLAIMLGVRRAGVTLAVQDIERRGLIAPRRGEITILDRAGLIALAVDSYGAPEAEYARLFGFDFRREVPGAPAAPVAVAF